MFYTTLLVLLFFGVLVFKHRVLYAPSDFQNEENWITAMKGVQVASLDQSNTALEELKITLANTTKQIGDAGEQERIKLNDSVKSIIENVQAQIESSKGTILEDVKDDDPANYADLTLQKDILLLINNSADKKLTYSQLAPQHKAPMRFILANLILLRDQGFIAVEGDRFRLTQKGKVQVNDINIVEDRNRRLKPEF